MTNLPSTLQVQAEQHWTALANTAEQHLSASQCRQLKQLLGLSDFVAQSCRKRPQVLSELAPLLSDNQTPNYQHLLQTELASVTQQPQLLKILRQFRQRHSLRIAWLDLLNLRPLEKSLQEVSNLAFELINQSYLWLYQQACIKYGTPTDNQDQPQHLHILAMGKLGGNELNFSSDIDLIFCYPQAGEFSGRKKPLEYQQFFTRLAQQLITCLDHITADGLVYRVDMRLRPFGDSGPLVCHFAAFEDYYQNQGREWERYAMVKATPCNPHLVQANVLPKLLKPFVYRRYLDFSAIESLRQMKLQIIKEVQRRQLNNNIKLGAGGIREVEFIVQSFQLIRGGREPTLQTSSLLDALRQLPAVHCLTQQQAQQLEQAYLFLRKAEHCIQQFHDQQSQTLPSDTTDQLRLAHCMGFEKYTDFLAALTQQQQCVHQQFTMLIGGEQEEQQPATSPLADLWLCDLTPSEAAPLMCSWLKPQQHADFLHQLSHLKQRLQLQVGQRGQVALDKLMPQLLDHIAHTQILPSDKLLQRLSSVLASIAGRTTYLELLTSYPQALSQLVKLCAASPWITELVADYPALLDELIKPIEITANPKIADYLTDMRQHMLRIEADDLEAQMEALREFKLGWQLNIAAAEVTGKLDTMLVSDHLTYLAQAIVDQVVRLAWQQMSRKYGLPKGTLADEIDVAVIAYGKLGGYELSYASDLDLVLLHNNRQAGSTSGPKVIDNQQFYLKLAQRINHLFSTKTRNGQLYEIDMRLRPSGNAGLLISPIDAFAQYQQQQAWVWEHQALVRARCIFGSSTIQQQFDHIRKQVLSQPRDNHDLQTEIRQMRDKMRQHLQKGNQQQLDLKQGVGGITDIEFLAQYWVLAHSHQVNTLTQWPDNVRILQTLCQHQLISQETAQQLTDNYLSLRSRIHILALQQQPALVERREYQVQIEQTLAIWQRVLPNSCPPENSG